jgi:serine phosphatase RsbU (regulator of sigma subunit)
VLGLSLRVNYRQRSVPVEPGDLLIAASEGVTDSVREDEILRIAKRQRQSRAVRIVREILDSTQPVRDRTVVAVRIQGRREAVFQAGAEVSVAC